jgi:hypothetical protein
MTRDEIPSSDRQRDLSSIFDADERNLLWARRRDDSSVFEQPNVEDFYNDLSDCGLSASVPKEIRTHFETGKNLYLYSWFCYRFGMVCELHTYTTIELALKTKFEKENVAKPYGLSGMLKAAIARTWVSSAGFEDYQKKKDRMLRCLKADEQMFAQIGKLKVSVDYEKHEREFADKYLDSLTRFVPGIRNELGHGSPMLMQPSQGLQSLFICRDLVNQLFHEDPPMSNVGHTT